jgi:hypothetical protein
VFLYLRISEPVITGGKRISAANSGFGKDMGTPFYFRIKRVPVWSGVIKNLPAKRN